MRGEVDCKAPKLQLLRHNAVDMLRDYYSDYYVFKIVNSAKNNLELAMKWQEQLIQKWVNENADPSVLIYPYRQDDIRWRSDHAFLHIKRDWNQSDDRLASEALQREKRVTDFIEQECQNLITLNRLDELLLPK